MKMKNSFLLFLFLFLINLYIGYSQQSCTEDWNCPNQPYQFCAHKWIVDARSFVVGRDDFIYFTARRNTDNGQYGASYLLKVPKYSSSNNPPITIVYQIEDEIANGPVFNRVNGAIGANLLPGGKVYIVQDMYRYLPLYGTYNPTTKKFTTAFKQNPENGIFVHAAENKLYRCVDNRLESLSPIPLDLNDTPQSINYYNTSYCNGLWKNGNTLYFTQRIFSGGLSAVGFYIGNTDCRDCAIGKELFYVMDNVLGFAANDKFFFYSTQNGLFRVPINGDVSQRYKLSDNPNIKGIGLDNEAVFYATSTAIVRIDLDDQYITLLYDSAGSQTFGTCKCISEFTGSSCTSCNGTITWSNGKPTCNLFLADGTVSYCEQDWQCLNSPFNYCSSNACKCRTGFSGSRCELCSSNNITWSDSGIPTCNLYYHGYTTSY
ncbi:hypothetical protein DICPUDRAFT_92139 [Dictyostelium purpureum]|uniref:EGF-like domain-containing protein n=1 Tax=Dictyostelium purpureum TaxID=5786 RepID=F0ZMN8_DICPU|nr:uncharacterized protein DICPUDRAFT_92139 [Dictyostelium purpureum]EGC34775.1 hypothetical protein DICPUDRAFT_92139 [Dictyostelium purpureum]|eukprot:XP_003288690.1 hypothetical protein DICPUDRAFT_92139 [Dictyostelium purpureum]